jgi:hypothetical protein
MAGMEMGYLSPDPQPKPFTDNDIKLGQQYYATNELPIRIATAVNQINAEVPGANWIIFLIGCSMVSRKIYLKRKKNK